MESAERVYTLQEAAERLHMPYRTLRDAIYAGRWPHRKISERRRLMTEEDIQDVLAMSRQEPKPTVSPHTARQTKANVLSRLKAA